MESRLENTQFGGLSFPSPLFADDVKSRLCDLLVRRWFAAYYEAADHSHPHADGCDSSLACFCVLFELFLHVQILVIGRRRVYGA